MLIIKVVKHKISPVVLAHILVLISVYRSGVKLGKAVVVAVDEVYVNRQAVVAFVDNFLGADFF